jgi:hypothetical protein
MPELSGLAQLEELTLPSHLQRARRVSYQETIGNVCNVWPILEEAAMQVTPQRSHTAGPMWVCGLGLRATGVHERR